MPDIVATRPTSGAPVESGWGQQMHDAVEGVQAGSGTVTFSASPTSGVTTITFPRAYAAPPLIVVSAQSQHYQITVNQGTTPTATNFQVAGRYIPGTNASTTIGFTWLAIGTPA